MKEHNCKKINPEYVILTGPFGWFLCLKHAAISCQITHCPFCGEKLNEKDIKYVHLINNIKE